ncbi:MAG: hypothetical protein PHX74_10930 [Candidatus Sumerlaeales bacterium]|nr:hypothetical protein [Candidatus Sumerlaeales bacterium]
MKNLGYKFRFDHPVYLIYTIEYEDGTLEDIKKEVSLVEMHLDDNGEFRARGNLNI